MDLNEPPKYTATQVRNVPSDDLLDDQKHSPQSRVSDHDVPLLPGINQQLRSSRYTTAKTVEYVDDDEDDQGAAQQEEHVKLSFQSSGGSSKAARPVPGLRNFAPSKYTGKTVEYVDDDASGDEEEVPASQNYIDEQLDELLGDYIICDRKKLRFLETCDANADLNPNGLKPIHVAVIHKNTKLLRRLLDIPGHYTDINARYAGATPLHFAARLVSLDIVGELLEQPHVEVNALTSEGEHTPLMSVITTNSVQCTDAEKATVVQRFVDDPRCRLDEKNRDDWLTLTFAAKHGNIPAAAILLADQRKLMYSTEELINVYLQAAIRGNDLFCDYLMDTTIPLQRDEIRNTVRRQIGSADPTPYQRGLIHHAGDRPEVEYADRQPSSAAFDMKNQLLAPGSVVQLMDDRNAVRTLQKNVGPYLDSLDKVVGKTGLVRYVDSDGVLRVDFNSGSEKVRTVNSKAVMRQKHDDMSGVDADGVVLHVGDTVRLLDDPTALEHMASGTYPLSRDDIKGHAGQVGVIKLFNQTGFPVVFVAGLAWILNCLALKKVTYVIGSDGKRIHVGDTVEICSNESALERMQTKRYGGWKSFMAQVLGDTGVVTHIGCECLIANETPDCTVTVKVGKRDIILNPKAVTFRKSGAPPPAKEPEVKVEPVTEPPKIVPPPPPAVPFDPTIPMSLIVALVSLLIALIMAYVASIYIEN